MSVKINDSCNDTVHLTPRRHLPNTNLSHHLEQKNRDLVNPVKRIYSLARITFNALSYVHIVTALAGAALIKLTVNPRYKPLTPCVLSITSIVLTTPLYSGILVCTYRARCGPWTCSLLRTRSSGNTPVFAITLDNTPAAASLDPNGRRDDISPSGNRSVSYVAKKRPIYGTICATAAEQPRKKPLGPSVRFISRIESIIEA